MTKTRYRSDPVTLLIGSIFTFIGVITAIIFVVMFTSWLQFKKTAVEIPATITKIETHRYRSSKKTRVEKIVYIDYDYEGENYDTTLGYYSFGMREGGSVAILVDPTHPSRIKAGSVIPNIILAPFALIFGGIGLGFLISDAKRRAKVNRLIDMDRYVYCSKWEETRGSTRVNNVRYHCIKAYYNNGFKDLEFTSRDFHPNKCPARPGDVIRVFVDVDEDPTVYYVDI
ncbi:MAG: DUF3592 domain-containing protein [Oscillospiraceae bacterium]|nr:DUF3592 domain-containing protein [Oscillospiraceae bacterium]